MLVSLLQGSSKESVRELLIPHKWSLLENQAIDEFCVNFCKRSLILAVCSEQPTLENFLAEEDEGLLNENVEGEVFDIDKIPENLIRARITKYNICDNTFEIDTDQLDVWETDDKFTYWTQPGINLNDHLRNGNAKHISNPLILPKIEEIVKGTFFGAGVVGHTIELKINNRWRKGIISEKLETDAMVQLPDGSSAKHNDLFTFVYDNQVSCRVDLRQFLLSGTLRINESSHVLSRLQRCLSAQSVPAQAARSMPVRVWQTSKPRFVSFRLNIRYMNCK